MACPACQRLGAKLEWLERVHAEKVRTAEAVDWNLDHRAEFRVLRSAESDARLAVEIARAELKRHNLDMHGAR
jgi:hypothetical protein